MRNKVRSITAARQSSRRSPPWQFVTMRSARRSGSGRDVVGIMSGVISDKLIIAY